MKEITITGNVKANANAKESIKLDALVTVPDEILVQKATEMLRVNLQNVARQMLKQGMTAEEVQTAVNRKHIWPFRLNAQNAKNYVSYAEKQAKLLEVLKEKASKGDETAQEMLELLEK